METIVRISSLQPRWTDWISIFDSWGSSGNSAILNTKEKQRETEREREREKQREREREKQRESEREKGKEGGRERERERQREGGRVGESQKSYPLITGYFF